MWGWRGKRDRDVQTLRCVEIENKKRRNMLESYKYPRRKVKVRLNAG